MKQREKYLHIMPTYFTLLVSTVIGLAVVRWSVEFVSMEAASSDDTWGVWDVWIPVAVSLIACQIWLRSKIDRLKANTNRIFLDRLRFMPAWLTIALPSIVIQSGFHESFALNTPNARALFFSFLFGPVFFAVAIYWLRFDEQNK